jgi:hypothetical protein
MQKLMRRTALAASVAALVMAPAAMAQGGAGGGGGGTGGGGTATTVAGGGGGGGTGGLNKGGVKDVGAPAVPACATLTGVGAPVGYYSIWAALWNQYTVRSCSTATESLSVTITNTNVATGAVDFSSTAPVSLTPGQNSSSVVDNDFAPFSTDYNVEIQVQDGKGTVLDTQSLLASTPPQR